MSNRDALLKTVFDNHTITTETIRTTTFYKILDTRGKNCITFHYYTDTDGIECIGIGGLDRCSLYTGTELLNKIEEFAKKASIKRLHLEDASHIKLCDNIIIRLYYLDILCTGQSWYNKHGYKSEYHHKELAHNREFINRPMIDIIKNDEEYLNEEYLMLSNILNPNAKKPDVNGTVQEVFVQLKRYLINNGDNCSDPVVVENLKFIRDLIKAIGKHYIKYDGELLDKEIVINGGTKSSTARDTFGSTKRMGKKSKKSRRGKTARKQ